MIKVLKRSKKWTTVDSFNTVKSKPISEEVGKTFKVRAVSLGEDVDRETGDVRLAANMVMDSGEMFSSISKTVIEQLDALVDILASEDTVEIQVCCQPCKNTDANYIYLDLV